MTWYCHINFKCWLNNYAAQGGAFGTAYALHSVVRALTLDCKVFRSCKPGIRAMDPETESFDIASTVTRLRRLSLALPDDFEPPSCTVTYSRLMDLSIEHVEGMVHSPEPDRFLIGARILDNAKDYQRWENEHSVFMHRVAERRRTRQQSYELLGATFQLIHRKALFSHLRDQGVKGERRERLVQHFSGQRGYMRGLIAEHGIFLRSSASLYCSSYLGTNLLCDAVFRQPLHDYEQLYAAYFDAHCEYVLAADDAGMTQLSQSVVYSLKCDLAVLRRTIGGLVNRISIFQAHRLGGGG